MEQLELVIMKHEGHPGGGPHYDIRIQAPGEPNMFYSWALKYKPNKDLKLEMHGKRIILIQTALHRRDAAYYTGEYKNSHLTLYHKAKINVIKQRLNRGNKKGKHFIVFSFPSNDSKYKNQKWILFEIDKLKHIWILFRGKDEVSKKYNREIFHNLLSRLETNYL